MLTYRNYKINPNDCNFASSSFILVLIKVISVSLPASPVFNVYVPVGVKAVGLTTAVTPKTENLFPVTSNIVAKVLSAVPVDPAGQVWSKTLEVPVPVDIPPAIVKMPPPKSVPPTTAPPTLSVRFNPAVAAVTFLSVHIILAACPERESKFVGEVVPMPTLPLVSIKTRYGEPLLVKSLIAKLVLLRMCPTPKSIPPAPVLLNKSSPLVIPLVPSSDKVNNCAFVAPVLAISNLDTGTVVPMPTLPFPNIVIKAVEEILITKPVYALPQA